MGLIRTGLLLVTFGFLASAQISYKCDFEDGICDFLFNDRANAENWKIGKGKLKTGETGPSVDHTKGNANGTYLFVDMSRAKRNEVKLETQSFTNEMCVKFFYHMYGADVGNLQVSIQKGWTGVIHFARKGSQGDRWKEAHFTTRLNFGGQNNYKIVFAAKGRSSSKVLGDIALDDIEIYPGKCKDTKWDAFELCSFNEYNCGYASYQSNIIKWEWRSMNQIATSFKYTVVPETDHTLGTTIGGYWQCGDIRGSTYQNLGTATLSSPEYPQPKEQFNCLHFYFYLQSDGTSFWYGGIQQGFIQVFLNFPSSSRSRTWVGTKALNSTTRREWNYVEAQLDITEKFQLQFIAGLMTPVQALLAIDDVKLVTGRCPEAGSCDFEQNKCTWVDGEEDYSWIRKQPSSYSNREIGPPIDNTLGTEEGTYIVFNTNNKDAGSKASLESEYIPPMKDDLCLIFYYFMQGENLGTLKVMRKEENITQATLWVLKGPQRGLWNKATVQLRPSMLHTKVIFQGITGTGSNAYMALDDIRMRNGQKCELSPRDADPRYDAVERLSCTFDDLTLCLWKLDASTLNWKFGNGSLLESTGPKEPLNGQGHYIFISSYEGTQSNNEKVARIISPSVSSFYPDAACFSFYFHMFGAHVGELRVVLVPMKDEKTPLGRKVIWRRRSTQPDKWIQFRDSLNITEGDYRIEIEAEGGAGFAGDIAIDNIMMSFGECPNVDICDFESSLCGWKVEPNSQETFYWERGFTMPKGPTSDHTTLTDGGFYLQAVAEKDAKTNDVTSLISPQFGTRWGPHCLTFWYHRAGLGTGSLSVFTRENQKDNLQWSAIKDVGTFWHYGQVNINAKSDLQLVIQAMKGPSNDNEIALDDILIKNSKCGEPAECKFNTDYCSYSQNGTSDFSWLLGTGRVVNTQLMDNPPADYSVENGMYVYADMTSLSIKENQRAVLVSEILEGSSYQVMCFRFYFFVSGKKTSSTFSMGKMTLDNSEKDMQYKVVETWSWKEGETKGWLQQAQNVAVKPGEQFQVYFVATRLTEPMAFIAIDDISASDGQCTTPTTEPPPPVTEMPYSTFSCDFDDGTLCNWKYSAGRLRWQVNERAKIQDKMPKFDHTQGNYLGRYSYVMGDRIDLKESQITSPFAPITWKGNFCLSFWYIMNVDNSNNNRLRIDATHKVGWQQGLYTFWQRKGNYGYKWRHVYVHIKSAVNTPKVNIVAFVKTGVIAVDDIGAKQGSCPPTKICTFDDDADMCSYTQDSKNNLNWDVKSGEDNGTLAAIADHTTQSIEGKYLYVGVDGTSKAKFQKARIYSPKRKASQTASCVTFYYHIHNVSKLTLNTYVSTPNGVSDPQWSVSVGQGLLWHGARFTVSSSKHSWQVVFEVEVGEKGYGQVAIDDISIDSGACADPGFCDFEDEDCLWENIRPPTNVNLDPLDVQNADVKKELLEDDYDWVRHIGEDYFGPPKDHTQGSPQGFYLLLDTKEANPGQKAVYMSERFRAPAGVCLKMWYAIPSYPNGATLQVYVSSDFKNANQLKLIKEPTNEVWTEALVSVLPPISSDSAFNDFWIFLAGKAGNHTLGYIAIDDISVVEGLCEEKTELFDCRNGQHVLATDVCNFKKDCSNGNDEVKCATCDFESDYYCGWTITNRFDYFRWDRTRAGIGILGIDHTKGDSTGYYISASALGTWWNQNLNANLKSVVLRNAFSTCSMTFYYHIKNKADFKVTLERGNKAVDLWIPPGNSDNLWIKAEVFLGRISRTFKLNFFVKRERAVEVFVAVDDIAMIGCETLNTGGPGMCRSDQFDCKNSRCISKDNICDYTDDCGNFEDERPEMCVTAISRCSFDQSFCNWISDNTTGVAFQLREPFSSLDQGPTRDHTSGFSNGKFLYLPGRVRPVPARLIGPILQPAKGCQIRLYYDIRSSGTLYLQIKTKTASNGEEKVVYSREDPTEGYFFVEDRYTFNETTSFQVIIEASITAGQGKVNYIAMDDISFNYKCVPLITPLPTVEPVISTPPPKKECKKGEFACNNDVNQCIPMNQKCNFKVECTNGADEDHCGACDFHQDMCGLVNINTWARYKWQRANAEVFSELKNSTVPDADSTGDKKGYFAVLTGKTSNQFSSASVMRTTVLGEMSHACTLQFHYHFNIAGGTLAVYVNQPGVSKRERKFIVSQNSGKYWRFASIPLGNYNAGKWIEFEGNTLYNKISNKVQDIAIDNIQYFHCDPTITYNTSVSCNFDTDECGWFPDNEVRTAAWTWAKKAPSNEVPQSDHTGKGGSFVYVRSGTRLKKGTKAHLVSLKQNPTEKRCFSFWYHMYGPDVGTLNIIIRSESNSTIIWRKTDSQGNAWKQGMRTIRQDTPYNIVIEGILGSFARPVIAIDDIEVAEEECPHPYACEFEADFCEWDSTGWVLQLGKGNVPSKDHTTDTETGRYAALMEDSGRLVSPEYNFTNSDYCLNFWYFAEGGRDTFLRIQREEEPPVGKSVSLWTEFAEPNTKGLWRHSRANVPDLNKGDYHVVIYGEKKSNSYLALDDLAIETEACPLPGSCNFERDFCTWRNLPAPISRGLQWLRNSGKIVGNLFGPHIDHTTGSTDGWYVYLDAQYGNAGTNAVLESENLHYAPEACFKLWYHMTATQGTLEISYVDHNTSKITVVTTVSGYQIMNWYPMKQFVKNLPDVYRVRIKGIKGTSGSIAIDDIEFRLGTCNEPVTTTPPPTEFPPSIWDCSFESNDFCSWIQGDAWIVQDGRKALDTKKGPSADHTKESALGRYAYYNPLNDSGHEIMSETIDVENSDYCFRFWYYMHSVAPVSLEIYALQYGSMVGPLWQKKTSAGTNWKYGTYFLEKSVNVSMVFRAKRENVGVGDIALDDIIVNAGRCPTIKGQPCDFESADICGFKASTTDGIMWRRVQAKSIRKNQSGPKMDKTYQTSEGHYMLVRPSPSGRVAGDNKALLTMPNVPSTDPFRSCVRFWYQMTGENVIALNLYVKPPQGGLPQFSLWSHASKHGNDTWRIGQRTIDANYIHEIVFEAVMERGDKGYIALDDIVVKEGSCPPPGSCTFEEDLCSWQNAESNVNLEWVRNSGPTPTLNTGPEVDRTLGTATGSYIYLQGQNPENKRKLVGILQSEFFSLSTERCLSFWAHMYGKDMGTLLLNLTYYDENQIKTLHEKSWNISGDQGPNWFNRLINIKTDGLDIHDEYQIHFIGITGGALSDIALDDIEVTRGKCYEIPDDAFDCRDGSFVNASQVCDFEKDCKSGEDELHCGTCDFEQGECGWRDITTGYYMKWKRVQAQDEAGVIKGPGVDHTFNAPIGYFMISENNFYYTWSPAVFQSPSERFKKSYASCYMIFYYAFKKDSKASLRVIKRLEASTIATIWERYGYLGDDWQKGVAYLSTTERPFYVEFSMEAPYQQSYVAIDDIVFENCNMPEARNSCGIDEFKCSNDLCVSKYYLCDLTDDCGDRSDEAASLCSKYPKPCTFESYGDCEWAVKGKGYNYWRLESARYSRGNQNQGPLVDHSKGVDGTGRYLALTKYYTDKFNQSFYHSPNYKISSDASYCSLRFYYYMHGSEDAYIKVHTEEEKDGWTWLERFREFGTLGQVWNRAIVNIRTRKPFHFIIEGFPGYNSNDRVAIDDLSLSDGCQAYKEELPTPLPTPLPTKSVCTDKEFKCTSGQPLCIPKSKFCDFALDCSDGSDEEKCGPCNFDKDFCGWRDESAGLYTWTRKNASLDDSFGPKTDSKNSSVGWYAYVKEWSGVYARAALLVSPPLPPVSTHCVMAFWLYVSRSTSGNLYVEHKPPTSLPSSYVKLWSLPRSFKNSWQLVEVKIPGTSKRGSSIRFNNLPSWNYFTKLKNVAIDDIKFLYCNPNELMVDCNFDDNKFNGGLCHWSETSDNYINLKWKRGKGSTTKNFTGPTSDHTTGHGYYMYLDSDFSSPFYSARLESPLLPMNLPEGNCFSFWYHMYGTHVGTLSVRAMRNSFYMEHFRRSRTQGNKWQFAQIYIKASRDHKITIFGETSWGKEHNIAIDDVKMVDGTCPRTPLCDFESSLDDLCGWNSTFEGLSGWERVQGSGNWSEERPSKDHTTNSDNGHFLNLPFKRRGDLARLESPLYKNYGDMCIKFWYSMFGSDIGTLAVYQRTKQEGRLDNLKNLWKRSGDHSGSWKLGRVTMNSLPEFYIAIEAQTSNGPVGYISLDDIEVSHGKCSDPVSCTFEIDTCGWRNSEAFADFQWVRRTGSDENIGDGPIGDHTTFSIQGHYMYALLTGAKQDEQSMLLSEDLEIYPNYCLSLWYNMYKAINSSLNVRQLLIGMGWEDVKSIPSNSVKSGVWKRLQTNITTEPAGDFFQLGITAFALSDFDNTTDRGIAVDDLSLIKSSCGQKITTTTLPPPTTTEYPPSKFDCTFETGFCLWENDPEITNAKWENKTGHSDRRLTRPRTDHSLLSSSGHYLTLSDSAKASFFTKATLRSIDGVDASEEGICFKFWYHMNGNNPGSLYLKIQNFHDEDKTETVWSKSKSQGPDWKYGQVHIARNYAFKLVLEGDGTRYGDISLDDFSLNYNTCPPRDFCDVETDYCGFSHDPKSDVQWHRGNGSRTNGPDIDHTLGSSFGNYFYIDKTASLAKGKRARLETGLYQPDKRCMQFWYYLNGIDVGTLEVLVRNGGTTLSKWKETGDNSLFWQGSEVLLTKPFVTPYSYIFQVTAGSAFSNGTIAIDDIAIQTECPPLGSCNFEDGMCLWNNDPTADLQWIRGSGEVTDAAPENDTTLGNQFGVYLYAHVIYTWKSTPTPARLISPYFPSSTKRCINYWNYRNGTDFNGALTVSIYIDSKDEITELQHFTNEKLGRWNNEQVEVSDEDESDINGKYQILFEAQLTETKNNFIALDDITVYEGECIPIEDRKPEFTCDDGETHISDDFRCDFYEDCKDGLDEKSCGTHCDFEVEEPDPCNWKTSPGGATWNQTLANGTAEPNMDHTNRNPGEGYYMKATFAKYVYKGEAHMNGPALIQSSPTCRMFFWYYFNALLDDEALFIYYDAGHVSKRTELFRLEGERQKSWLLGEVVVGRINNRFRLGIGANKQSVTGVIAIDDINFENCDMPRRVIDAKPCKDQEFQCDNGNCIPNRLLCDFVDDCGDNSDENNRIGPKCDQYPGRCDFEGGNYCGWQRAPESDYSWEITKFSNDWYYSKKLVTRDHTKNSASGQYLYFSNSYHYKGQVARLASKVMEATNKDCSFRFFYTYGRVYNSTKYDEMRDIGTLTVYIRRDEVNVWKTIFISREPPGQYYEKVILPLEDYEENPFEVIIESRIGSTTKTGGWAVDDISFSSGCTVSNKTLPLSILEPTDTPDESCDINQFMCLMEMKCIDIDKVCDFVPDCSDASDEAKCGTCSFDDNWNPTCGWSDVRGYKWKRNKGAKGSNGLTTDVSGNGYYMYVDKEKAGAVSSLATLRSVDFKQSSATCEISFYYFMSGIMDSDASLKLQLQTNEKHDVMIWMESSDQGKKWINTTASIGRREDGWHLDFIATHVLSKGDIAIDEINFLNCAPPEKRICANKREFACFSGECINSSLVCDFSLDCPDGSDEDNCTSYMERCDFEKDFCTWEQDSNAKQKWVRTSGKKLAEGTGPDRDHTIGDETGHFLLAEIGSYFSWYLPRIISTAFMADTSGNCKLRFWYHLYLPYKTKIIVSMNYQDDNRYKPITSIYGTDGDVWDRAEITLNSKFNFHVAIDGSPASGNKGDVAIDDISFSIECIPVYTIITTPVPTIQPKGVCERKGQFACEDNECVPMDVICDFKKDCLYGLDEKSCPSFCDFELGSKCGWKAITNDGDGLEINVTTAEESIKIIPAAPKVDKTTNTSQGSYLLIHSTIDSQIAPSDDYVSPTFVSSASTCKFSFWIAARMFLMQTQVILMLENESIDMIDLKHIAAMTWVRIEFGIGRQKGNFSLKFNKRSGMQRFDFIAIDDIEFVDCALPKRDPNICLGYRCKETKACVDFDRICDLTDDCGDGTDEVNCTDQGFLTTNFEHGFGMFKLYSIDKLGPIQWAMYTGSWQTYFTRRTGAPFDHTFSNSDGHYVAMSKRPKGGMNEKALLISEVLRSVARGECQMRFHYYMFGYDVNELNIYTIRHTGGNFTKIFTQTGAVGNFWMRGSVTLKDTAPFQVIFEGKTGVDFSDVIAVDDISFTPGCRHLVDMTLPPKDVTGTYPITTPLPTTCKPGEFFCKDDKVCISGSKKCDFREDCKDKSDEADCVKPKCDFENSDLYGWEIDHKWKFAPQNNNRTKRQIDDDHAFKWIAIQAKDEHTQINKKYLPRVDHTTNSTEGWYLLADGAPGVQGDITSLISPTISATHTHCAMEFWVYRGRDYAKLNVYAGPEKDMKKLWNDFDNLSGYYGLRYWENAKVPLGALTNYKVKFEAIRPSMYSSVIGLDDISFVECEPPVEVDPEEEICDGGYFMCRNNKCVADNLLCDYSDDCTDFSDERDVVCQAYVGRCNFETAACKDWIIESDKGITFNVITAGLTKYFGVPYTDHTTNSNTGKFLSVTSNFNSRGTKPKIRSQTIDGYSTDCKVRFWYHTVNYPYKINIYKRTSYKDDGMKFMESFSTDFNYWHRVEVQVFSKKNEDFQIVIEADLYSRFGSVNIDDISLTPGCHYAIGRDIPDKPTVTPPTDDCAPEKLACANGECYTHLQHCNFIQDCADGTDENNCGTSCDFENGSTCGWFNPPGYYGIWEIQAGKSKFFGKLKKDHTIGTSEGRFLFAKNTRAARDIAQIHTQTYVLSSTNCKLSLWYFIDQSYGGQISIILVRDSKTNKYQELWNVTKDAEPEWQNAVADIGLQENFGIIIQATFGTSYLFASLAIDDIEFLTCSPEHPPVECAFDEWMCANKERCIKVWAHCDGKYDCNDKSDEYKCQSQYGDCNFDSDNWKGDCQWESKAMDFEWSRAKEGRSKETGPQRNQNPRQEGYFLFIDSSKQPEGSKAGVVTPVFKPSDGLCHLRFWYFMYGSPTLGTLEVRVEGENGQSFVVWMKKGVQIENWLYGHSVVGSDQNYRVVFVGTVGGDDKTDIAIDEVKFTHGCEEGGFEIIPTGPTVLCTTDQFRCKNGLQCIPLNFKCDCFRDCEDGSDELDCPDPCASSLPPSRWTNAPVTSEQPGVSILPQKQCRTGEKLCNDQKTCIPGLLLCDGIKDCPDGSDETDGCGNAKLCGAGFYFCNDRSFPPCVARNHLCDGIPDCSDGSDESICNTCPKDFCKNDGSCSIVKNVPVCTCKEGFAQNRCNKLQVIPPTPSEEISVTVLPQKECKMGEKMCNDGKTCIPGILLCDGVKDCPDGSDEADGECGIAKLCGEGLYFCHDLRNPCVRRDQLCDGKRDCSDGSDESLCDTCPNNFCANDGTCSTIKKVPVCKCKEGFAQNRCGKLKVTDTTYSPPTNPTQVSVLPQKKCKVGEKLCNDEKTCIPGLLLCDGIKDCPDGSDETEDCGNSKLCGEGLYFCHDGKYPPCVRRDQLCDGNPDCSDGSDESICGTCPKDFCRNDGNCSIVSKVPVCSCKKEYAQNRCGKLKVTEDLENKPTYAPAGVGWIIGLVVGTLLIIAILFVIWYMRNTNAERSRLTHAVDNPVYGLNLDTLTFGELNSHMPIRNEDGAGATAIENPLYSFKSDIK